MSGSFHDSNQLNLSSFCPQFPFSRNNLSMLSRMFDEKSKLSWISCPSFHRWSSKAQLSILMGEGKLYCHDYHPMAELVDQSNLIWLDGSLKEQPDGSYQSGSVHWFTSCSQKALSVLWRMMVHNSASWDMIPCSG